MRLFGQAMLMTFTEVAPEHNANFSEWYNREHLDERINLPGFRRARRYEAVKAPIRYLSTYEATSIEAIASPRYLELLKQQTEWSQRVIKRFIKWHRISGRVMVDATHGIATSMVLVRLKVESTNAKPLCSWLADEALPQLNRSASVVGSCAIMADAVADDRLTRGLGQTPVENRMPEWAIIVEGTDLGEIEAAAQANLSGGLPHFASGGEAPTIDTYHLLSLNQRLGENEKA